MLLTTHSMQEAEALCTRIGIVSGGVLRCIGTSGHLKDKFGKGYTLTVNSLPAYSAEEDVRMREKLLEFIRDEVAQGHGELVSSINRTSKFLIPKGSATISDVFHKMENNKSLLRVREWGLSMATLEEVFVTAVQTPAGN
jgi:ABC-type multidrug transport system ATPase subunit